MKYKHILITGGAGFIGSFLADKLVDLGYQVTIFDNLEIQVHHGRKPNYLNPKARFIKGDLRNARVLKTAIKGVDVIFHEAAAVGVAQSNYQIKHYTDVNVGGTANLLDVVANDPHRTVKKILTTSSMTAYGEGYYHCRTHGSVHPDLRPYAQVRKKDWQVYCPQCHQVVKPVPTPETASQPCNSVYALTKKAQEDMLLLVGKIYDIPVTTLRCFNVYGPRQSLSNPYTGVAAIFISRLKNNKPPIVYEDGGQTRDFTSVHDVVEALILAMNSSQANYHTFNVASGQPTTIAKLALTLSKLMHKPIHPQITDTPRKNDIRHCFADIAKAKSVLKWQPKVTLEQGLQELIDWSLGQKAVDSFDQANQELQQKGII